MKSTFTGLIMVKLIMLYEIMHIVVKN